MTTTIITTKGQVVIPAKIRRRMHIKKGARFYIEERGDELVLRAVTPAYFERVAGILHTRGRLSKALLSERSKDMDRE